MSKIKANINIYYYGTKSGMFADYSPVVSSTSKFWNDIKLIERLDHPSVVELKLMAFQCF